MPRLLPNAVFIVGLFLFSALSLLWFGTSGSNERRILGDHIGTLLVPATKPTPQTVLKVPQRHQNIAVASTFGFHHDVYMALVWTLGKVLQNTGTIDVFAPFPFGFDFGTIVKDLNLYNGTIHDPKTLIRRLSQPEGEAWIDMVVLGTCEVESARFLTRSYSSDLY
jgi:hypothetical protein